MAIKVFNDAIPEETHRATQSCIEALVREGVRLPRTAVIEIPEDGMWVQVSPLFGSIRRGSKFHQPAHFYKSLDYEQKAFALDQLTRVVNAGYSPSLDLFVVFKDPSKGIIPLDLDLIAPEPDITKATGKLLSAIIQVGDNADERNAMLRVAVSTANNRVRAAVNELMRPDGLFHRYWTLD